MPTMAKECVITGKSSLVAGGYSNRVRATKFTPLPAIRKYANLQKKKVFIAELGKTVNITVSTAGLRTIKKNGAFKAFQDAGLIR